MVRLPKAHRRPVFSTLKPLQYVMLRRAVSFVMRSTEGETVDVSLILGAGATLANALHFHGQRRTRQNPPLDYTFFDRVRSLEVPVPTELRDYASHLPYGNPFDLSQPARAEEFFRDLFADFEDAAPQDDTVKAYEQLLSIYMRVLRETTNWMSDDNKTGGPVGRLMASAAHHADHLSVLTFNHDLVIENEIQKRATSNEVVS